MLIGHHFFYSLAARSLHGAMLISCFESIRLKYPNTTLLNLTPVFLEFFPFILCRAVRVSQMVAEMKLSSGVTHSMPRKIAIFSHPGVTRL